jgi:DNA replication ATP-dependent helicase Dna2
MVIHIDTAPHQEHLLTGEQVPARRVHLLHERSRRVIVASLCGIWFDAPVRAGLYVALWHVREAFAPRRIVVDGEHGIVLVAPTHLLSGSVVAKASFCARRSLFDELFAAPLPERMINRNAVDINNTNKNGASAGGQGASAVSGQMMHELFQRALVANDFSDSALATSTGAIVRSYLVDLYAASLSDADALRFMAEAAPRVRQFADTLLGDAPRAMPVPFDASDAADQVRVQRVLAIEESVVSLVFGLKGKIDATVEIGVGADRNLVVPLELKTGRAGSSRVAHRAQAMLYAALLAERRAAVDALAAGTPATPTWLHSEALPSGGVALLHYLNPDVGGTEGVRLSWLELCALVSNRNDIVAHLTAPPAVRQMPPVLASTHGCRSCVQLPSCAVYHVANERGNGAYRDGFFADTVARMFGTLSESHLAYFRQWERALSLEEHASFESRRDVWSSSAESRERNGTCFADMRLNRVIDSERGGARVLYEFVRGGVAAEGGGGGELAPRSLLDGAINVGDTVTLSVENGPRGVLVGRVHRISDAAVVVSSRDPLRATARFESAQWRWRVDHEESTASFRGLRANVVQLLLSPRLCRLLVDLVPPEFGVSDGAPLLPSVHAMLNEAQRAAIERVRTARDYVLIHGMPGTGKSTTVAALLIQLIADGRSVLLAAHTHAAVDTVLVKLIEAGVSFMRLASNADSVHPAVLPYVPDASAGVEDAVADGASPSRFARPRTVAQLAELVESEPLVAVTCLGVHHPLLARRRFDVCVVDEASQLTQPAIVGALLCADRFVLVGDHQQLPPVVRNAEARLAGLDVSLFRVLSERYASATVELELEYRMNDDIVAVANALVYNGALRCGDERVAQARLHLPHLSARPRAAASFAHLDDWLERLLRAETTAAFLDTGAVAGARDSRATGGRAAASMSNAGEAALVRTVVVAFVACGLDARDIGVVTPVPRAGATHRRRTRWRSGGGSRGVHGGQVSGTRQAVHRGVAGARQRPARRRTASRRLATHQCGGDSSARQIDTDWLGGDGE